MVKCFIPIGRFILNVLKKKKFWTFTKRCFFFWLLRPYASCIVPWQSKNKNKRLTSGEITICGLGWTLIGYCSSTGTVEPQQAHEKIRNLWFYGYRILLQSFNEAITETLLHSGYCRTKGYFSSLIFTETWSRVKRHEWSFI